MKPEHRIILLSAIAGLFAGGVDVILDTLFFYEGSFSAQAIFEVSLFEIYIRGAILLTFIAFGIIVSREFAERKQTEEALKKSEEEKASILDATTDLITYHDPELRILWANKAAGESVGLSPEELVGHFCYEVWVQLSKPCPECPVLEALKTGQPKRSEVVAQDGAIWSHGGYPVLDEKGEVLGIVVSSTDITERKKVEEEVRESEEKHRLLFENSDNAIFYFDTKGKVMLLNRSGAEYLGWETKDAVGRSIYDMFPKEVADVHLQRFSRTIKEGKGGRFEDSFELPEGKRYFSSDVQPMRDASGNITGVQVIAQDITERKQAENELRQKLEELERTHRLMVGRELRMKELKGIIKELEARIDTLK